MSRGPQVRRWTSRGPHVLKGYPAHRKGLYQKVGQLCELIRLAIGVAIPKEKVACSEPIPSIVDGARSVQHDCFIT